LSGQRLSKVHRWRITEISSVLVSESLKIYQTTPASPHVVWEGFKKKQTLAYSVVRHNWNFKRDRIIGQMTQRRVFWQ